MIISIYGKIKMFQTTNQMWSILIKSTALHPVCFDCRGFPPEIWPAKCWGTILHMKMLTSKGEELTSHELFCFSTNVGLNQSLPFQRKNKNQPIWPSKQVAVVHKQWIWTPTHRFVKPGKMTATIEKSGTEQQTWGSDSSYQPTCTSFCGVSSLSLELCPKTGHPKISWDFFLPSGKLT